MRAGYSRPALVALASLATAAAAVVAPVAAASAAERTESLTVLLAPSDQAGFDALLTIKGLAQRDRSSFLAQVGPTRGARGTVVSRLTALGLHVESSTGWTVKASGPASVVDAFLGDRAALRRSQAAAARAGRRVTAPSSVPSTLAGLARAVVGGNDTTPIAHPLVAQTGASIRSLYKVSGTGSALPSHSALTVATLQLSGWNPADLTAFAKSQSLPDPVRSGQYVGVSVDGRSTTKPDTGSGSVEVALDQESLLAVAPGVRQRAYIAPNTDLGFFDAVNAVADDAVGNHPGIAALSISWGGCEAEWTGQVMDIMTTAFQQAVASGVTVFAASGDTGIYGCTSAPSAVAVDYPASDPFVVGVGGTTVASNNTETGWSFSGKIPDSGASGGGTSAHWGHPSWQGGSSSRQVPDVAADGAPSSGMVIYSTNARCTSSNTLLGAHRCQVGGTSLASPLFAGTFVATLAGLGLDSGVGDIHRLLYNASSSAFTDITSGNNGTSAGVGYDTVTGLGTPKWDTLGAALAPFSIAPPAYTNQSSVGVTPTVAASASIVLWRSGVSSSPPTVSCPLVGGSASLPGTVDIGTTEGPHWVWVAGQTPGGLCQVAKRRVVYDVTVPTVSAKIGLTTGLTTSVTASWKGADNAALDHYSIAVTHSGSSTPDVQGTTGKAAYAFVGKAGYTYRVTVSAIDKAGNVSAPATAKMSVPLDDKAFTLSAWKRASDNTSFGGSYVLASSTKAKASRSVSGRSYAALFTTCSTCGTANIYVGRTLVKTVNLYSARTHARVAFVVAAYGSTGSRAITVRPTGKKSAKSKGTQVRFDAVVAGS